MPDIPSLDARWTLYYWRLGVVPSDNLHRIATSARSIRQAMVGMWCAWTFRSYVLSDPFKGTLQVMQLRGNGIIQPQYRLMLRKMHPHLFVVFLSFWEKHLFDWALPDGTLAPHSNLQKSTLNQCSVRDLWVGAISQFSTNYHATYWDSPISTPLP